MVLAYLNLRRQVNRHHYHYFMFDDAMAQRSPLISLTEIPYLVWTRLVPEQGFSDSISIWTNSISWKICPCSLNIPRRESETALETWISNSILFNNHKYNWILLYLATSPLQKSPGFLFVFLTCVFQKFPTAKNLGKCQFLFVNFLLARNLKASSLGEVRLGSRGPPPAPPFGWG